VQHPVAARVEQAAGVVADGVVEAESLTQSTPSFSVTVSRRRGTPSNSRMTRPIASAGMSKASPTIALASAFAQRSSG
jgi:hypothetical protein